MQGAQSMYYRRMALNSISTCITNFEPWNRKSVGIALKSLDISTIRFRV